jgi:hypothetical protein
MFFKNLISGVDNSKEVKELIILTDESINNAKSLDNESINNELEKFRNFLEQSSSGDIKNADSPDDNNDNISKTYSIMINNLKALSQILINYNKTVSTATELNYTIKSGDTLKGIQINSSINKKKLSIEQIKDKNIKFKDFKEDQLLPSNSVILLESTFSEVKSSESGLVKGVEDHSTQALKKLKTDIGILISSKDKGISVDSN